MSAYVQKQSFNRKFSISALEQVGASSAWEADVQVQLVICPSRIWSSLCL